MMRWRTCTASSAAHCRPACASPPAIRLSIARAMPDGTTSRPARQQSTGQRPEGAGHALSGPVFIAGAEPGDTLEVRIKEIVPLDWGFNAHRPGNPNSRVKGLLGGEPDDVTAPFFRHLAIDWSRRVERDPAGDHRAAPSLHGHLRRRAGRGRPGADLLPRRVRRQHGLQGTGRGHDALSARLRPRRALLDGRRPRRAGRRRGECHRHRGGHGAAGIAVRRPQRYALSPAPAPRRRRISSSSASATISMPPCSSPRGT